jgi:hypothetical protein
MARNDLRLSHKHEKVTGKHEKVTGPLNCMIARVSFSCFLTFSSCFHFLELAFSCLSTYYI